MNKTYIVFALLGVSGFAFAQDSPDQNTSTSGAVVKGKAPVSKTLLRVKLPKPTIFKLSNGITVYAMENHKVPAIRISLEIKAGSLRETKQGAAGATAAALTSGTARRTADAILEEQEDLGCSVSSASSLETATVSMSCLAESFDKTLDLFTDCLLHPAFPEAELTRNRRNRGGGGGFGGRGGGAGSPTGLATSLLNRVFYAGTPYGRSAPTPGAANQVTGADIKACYESLYHPNGAIITATGDFSVKDLKSKLEAGLKEWKPSQDPVKLPEAQIMPKKTAKVLVVDRPNSAQTVVQFGSLAVAATDPDFIPLVVANRILGGGSSGRLFQNIRERKGYTYGAYSSLPTSKYAALWGASASVRTEVTAPAIAEFYNEFARLRETKVTDDELSRAKRSIIGSFARTVESTDQVLAQSMELVNLGLPMDYWDKYSQRIEAVNAADVQRVAKKYLDPSGLELVLVGDKSKFGDSIQKFGTVEVVESNKIESYKFDSK